MKCQGSNYFCENADTHPSALGVALCAIFVARLAGSDCLSNTPPTGRLKFWAMEDTLHSESNGNFLPTQMAYGLSLLEKIHAEMSDLSHIRHALESIQERMEDTLPHHHLAPEEQRPRGSLSRSPENTLSAIPEPAPPRRSGSVHGILDARAWFQALLLNFVEFDIHCADIAYRYSMSAAKPRVRSQGVLSPSNS